MSDSSSTLNDFLEYTELSKSKGLLFTDNTEGLTAKESHLLKWGRSKIKADALFVVYPLTKESCIPLIYFRRLEVPDPKIIAETHKLAWNMGYAPLLIIALPGEIKVFSTYQNPITKKDSNELDEEAGLIDTINLIGKVEDCRQKVMKYKREELLSGRYWERNKECFSSSTRVEKTLLTNLSIIRDELISEGGLNARIVHSLLGRAIFIQYLQDRKDANDKNVFPTGFFGRFRKGATNFLDILLDKDGTYKLFIFLDERFKGNIFPVASDEKRTVKASHLKQLADFLRGDMPLRSRQIAFWKYYSFDAIPIEFISNLYEEFFHYENCSNKKTTQKKQEKSGTFYTPHRLVEFLMDQALPWEGTETNIRIFDPACGSGIFLVDAYRRLIARWQQSNPDNKLSSKILRKLLTRNLFGVDSNQEALKVAAFSLYLTMCDYLEPRHIWYTVTFPSLDKNLICTDFFVYIETEQKKKFDIVIGNPPWESKLSEDASKFVKKHNYPIGDNQVAQAFLWGVTYISNEKTKIVMLVPSKALLFNFSGTNSAFREKFFSTFDIQTIINFSALRHSLFAKAVGPTATVIYKPQLPKTSGKILFCSPKPCFSPEDNWYFVIEPQDIAFVPVEQAIKDQTIWKAAMWGGPRDWELIQKLSQLHTVKELCNHREWVHGQGFSRGKKNEKASWLTNMPYITPKDIVPYTVIENDLACLEDNFFERPRKKIREIFEGPHLLISLSPKGSRGLTCTLLEDYAVFTNTIVAISSSDSDKEFLGAVCLAMNNEISLYYAMLTSGRWLIERDHLQKKDVMSLPLPDKIFDGKVEVSFDKLKELSRDSINDTKFNKKITSMYNLTQDELILINDATKYTLDYFYNKENSDAVKSVTDEMLNEYGQALCKVMNESFARNNGFSATILTGDMPQIVAHITLNKKKDASVVNIRNSSNNLAKAINALDQALLEKKSDGVYVRRSMKHYVGTDIYIVKRNQRRFWTQSAAFRDADEVYADIMSSWKG